VIHLESHKEGVVLAVRALPGSRRDEIRGEHGGALKVAVTQAPEKGKANKAIIELLARRLGIKRSQFELLSGETTAQKRFLIRGVTADALLSILGQADSLPDREGADGRHRQ
jgi:uncharacterized protein (TIGR00251 family)